MFITKLLITKKILMRKIPAHKRFLRVSKILLQNFLLFPFRLKKFKNFLNHIHEFEPIPFPENKFIKDIELEEIFPDIQKNEIRLRDLESTYGSMDFVETYYITLLITELSPKRIFEFGTFLGVTTLQMALNTDEQTKIFTLNLPPEETETVHSIGNTDEERFLPNLRPGNRFVNSAEAKKIVQLYGDSATFDYSQYLNDIDFIFIDGSHEYEYVKSDSLNAFNMIKNGGTIVWHDYPNAPGVYKFLNEVAPDYRIFHIKETHVAISINFEKNKTSNIV